ncbi:MAG TPA: ABC transporter ATP-binding protein [Dehalococcoidia bacterium]|jgi:ABC-2 type transport system ATP-binding protein|nr:ABC transporter ATP-binding protein [Dehalococcoidia bacterium]
MPTVESDIVLRTVRLTKRYGRRLALADLDLEVNRGRVHGFLGPNGAGKTTCISLILGLITAAEGHVEMFGLDTRTHLTPALRRTGAVLEGSAFYPHLSGRDNLRVLGALSGGVEMTRIGEVLSLVGLQGRAGDKVRGYSLGMTQRLALAAALLHDPELLILDEPTNGLDPAGMREFRGLIRRMAAAGKTVFVSSHLLNEVEQMCDDVAIIKEGRLITQGPVTSLVRRGDALEVKTTDNDRALAIIGAVEGVGAVSRERDSVLVEFPRERAAEISRALAEEQIYLWEMKPRESSLEDFFLEVTAEGASDG